MSGKTAVSMRRIGKWALAGLPIPIVVVASFFPLGHLFQQALIGFVLIWFQLSLMLGLIN